MDDDGIGTLIGLAIMLAVIGFIIYCIVILAGVIASVAGAGGLLWGGGTAIANYSKSFKLNVVDSNK